MRANPSIFVILALCLRLELTTAAPAIIFGDDTSDEPSLYNQTAGWQFTLLSPITVKSLGFYDGGADGLSSQHSVAIWNNAGQFIVEGVVPAGKDARREGRFRYIDVPPATLKQGVTYVIGSQFYALGDDRINGADSKESLIISSVIAPNSVMSRNFFIGSGIGFPPLIGGPFAYFGPNFQFNELPDIVALTLAWNAAKSTFEYSYEIRHIDLGVDTTAAFYWATVANQGGLIHPAIGYSAISLKKGVHGPTPVVLTDIGLRPPDAKYLVLVLDPISPLHPRGLVDEPDDVGNNLKSLELPSDLVARELTWDPVAGGVKFRVEVMNGRLPVEVPLFLYWANDNNERLGEYVLDATLPKGFTGAFPGDWRRFRGDRLYFAPLGATQLILSLDPENLAQELDAARHNNIKRLKDVMVTFQHTSYATRLSPGSRELIKRALRTAGHVNASVSSLQRTVEADVKAIYQNIYKTPQTHYGDGLAKELDSWGREELEKLFLTLPKPPKTLKEKALAQATFDQEGTTKFIEDAMISRAISEAKKIPPRLTGPHVSEGGSRQIVDIGPNGSGFPNASSKSRFQCALHEAPQIAKALSPIAADCKLLQCCRGCDASFHIEVPQPVDLGFPSRLGNVSLIEIPSTYPFSGQSVSLATVGQDDFRIEQMRMVNGFALANGSWTGSQLRYSFLAKAGDIIRIEIESEQTAPSPRVPDPTLRVTDAHGALLAEVDDSVDRRLDPLLESLEIPEDGLIEVTVDGWPLDLELAALVKPGWFDFSLSITSKPRAPTIWTYPIGDHELMLHFPSGGTSLLTAASIQGPWRVLTNKLPSEVVVPITTLSRFYKIKP